jgi:hypothetical protein
MEAANTLAYYGAATITPVKKFNRMVPGVNTSKIFMAVIVAVSQ